MAVKLPTLSRIETGSSLPSNNRITVKAQDNSASIASRTRGLTSTIQTGVNFGKTLEDDRRVEQKRLAKEEAKLAEANRVATEKAENKKVTTLTQEAQFKSKEWSSNKLRDMKSQGGDPTKTYASYDQESYENYLSIQKGFENATPRVKELVNANLERSIRSETLALDKQKGAHQETFDHNMHVATVKANSEKVTTAMGNTNEDASSQLYMTEALSTLSGGIVQRMVEKEGAPIVEKGGVTYRNDRGELVNAQLNDYQKRQLVEAKSKALVTAINNQIATGNVSGAKNNLDIYSKQIDAKSRTAILNKFKTASTKASAGEFLGKLDGKTEAQKKVAVNNIKDKVLQKEVLGLQNSITKHRNFQRDQKDKVNTEKMSSFVENQMESGVYTMQDFEKTKEYKLGWDELGTKGKKAVKEMMEAPKASNEKVLSVVQDAFFDTDKLNAMAKMSPSEFNRNYLVGLDGSDKKRYMKKFESMKKGALNVSFTYADKEIKKSLLLANLVTTDSKTGKLDANEQKILMQAQAEYHDYADALGRPLTNQETRELSKQLATDAIKETFIYKSDEVKFKALGSGVKVPPSPNKPGTNTFTPTTEQINAVNQLTSSERNSFIKGFKERNPKLGTPRRKDPRFIQYILEQQGII